MPRRMDRSSSVKKRTRKTEKGTSVQIRGKAPGKPRCVCGRVLSGVSRKSPTGSKSSRSASRPYGGMLCPVCAQERMRRLAREEAEV
jgi:ribosomal protein L34E